MSKKIKILLVDTGHEWGGGTNSMIELLKRIDRSALEIIPVFYHNYSFGDLSLATKLQELGYDLYILPEIPKSSLCKFVKELIRVVFFWNKRVRYYFISWVNYRARFFPAGQELKKLVAKWSIDVIYLNNQPSTNMEGYAAAILTGKPVVQHCRIVPVLSKIEVAITNRWARKIICVSDGVKVELEKKGVAPDLLKVIPNGIDCSGLMPKVYNNNLNDGSVITLGVVGSLIKRKRNSVILEAVAIIKRRYSSFKLVFLGEGPEKNNLKSQAAELGLDGMVEFIGFQKNPLEYIRSFDLLVSASEAEGLPRVILEAMGVGIPVVASDIPGTNNLVKDGETGLLFKLNDPEDLALCLSRLLESEGLRQQMGTAGAKRVRTDFSIEQYVEGVQKVLRDCVET